ncbi:FAD-dependent oxidoreductase [Dactylosporangium sucinum]|uniref:Salicylate hydroxylase n=1 Tax=Dactylosporangium sucinum TaxID=1424081 RepID=A0A917X8F6_9ACTN|nr:NAD(P)/FAD-dependent oxidoreductase [Dactylosporangium sucinum]GGM89444.1 salicylate hydroxylase [Dactylosporangium sucinum]
MKVVIIGAGVGGLASAIGLSAAGHEVHVYERSETVRAAGNGMIVWPNGTGILRELGVQPDELGMRMDMGEQLLDNGTKIFSTDYTDVAQYYGIPIMLIGRQRLVERLAGALPEGVLHLGAKVTAVRNVKARGGKPAGAVATFEDGTEVEADVLIGADGLGSVVRRHLHGNTPAAYTGWCAWHGATKAPIELTDLPKVQAYSGPAGVAALHPIGYGQLFWAFETPWREGQVLPATSPAGDAEAHLLPAGGSVVENLRTRFSAWSEPVPQLLESITDEDISLFPFVRHRVPRQWGSGRITLVGDAAHVVAPRTAQGVNQALEDAWVLTQTLSDKGDPAAQLRRYCNTRRSKIRALTITAKLMDSKAGLQFLGLLVKYTKQDSAESIRRNMRLYSNYLKKPAPLSQ